MHLHQTISYMQSFLIIIAGVYGNEQTLLFSTYEHLKEIDLGTGVVRTLTSRNDYFFSMAYDHKESYMYIPRYTVGDIMRFPYPNNQTIILEAIVTTANPVGIAFDSVNRHLYWSELNSGRIIRCNPNGSYVTIILKENRPTVLTLDIQNRWIYYGQQLSPSEISRINFDGMDKRVLIKNIKSHVFGIRLDVDAERLYWMEFHTGDLQSAWFDGSGVKTMISTNVTSENLDIDMDDDFIFYTSNNLIMKIYKSLGQKPIVVHTDTQQIYGVFLYKQNGKRCDEKKNSSGSCDYKNYNCDKEFLEFLRNAGFPRTFLPGLRSFNKC